MVSNEYVHDVGYTWTSPEVLEDAKLAMHHWATTTQPDPEAALRFAFDVFGITPPPDRQCAKCGRCFPSDNFRDALSGRLREKCARCRGHYRH